MKTSEVLAHIYLLTERFKKDVFEDATVNSTSDRDDIVAIRDAAQRAIQAMNEYRHEAQQKQIAALKKALAK